jgi:hypothetical protein
MTDVRPRLSLEGVARRAERILDEVERAVIGKRDALGLALTTLLAGLASVPVPVEAAGTQ